MMKMVVCSRICRFASVLPAIPVARYIVRQRNRMAANAAELTPELRVQLREYFPADVLESTRVLVSERLPIPDLPWARVLRHCGLYIPSPSTIGAITFDDVIAVRGPLSRRLLFHELVHVVQYRLLGVEAFAREYIAGFLTARSYDGIPLELCAYELEERFAFNGGPFDVREAVERYLAG
jgi:hypothetical protein